MMRVSELRPDTVITAIDTIEGMLLAYSKTIPWLTVDGSVYREKWRGLLARNIGFYAVLEEDGKLIGCISGYLTPGQYDATLAGTMIDWYVSPDCRKGGGLLLLRAWENWARKQGAKRLIASWHDGEKQTGKILSALGYKGGAHVVIKEG